MSGRPPDTDPPETEITNGAPNKLDKSKVKFKFTADEPNVTFECKVDKKPYKPCSSPKKVKRLDDGKHKFKVIATDEAGTPTPRRQKTSSRSSTEGVRRAILRGRCQQEKVEVYKRAVDANNRRDLDALLDEFDPDLERHGVGGYGDPGLSGQAGLREMFRDLDENFTGTVVEFPEVRDLGDRVLALGRPRARGHESGIQPEGSLNQLVDFKNGKVIRLRVVSRPPGSPRSRRAVGVGDVAGERGGHRPVL